MDTHELTLELVVGLATCVGGCASLILGWLRTDIRNLAAKVETLRQEFGTLKGTVETTNGILKGKGILT
jgi:outer membrane murein-binding lipoprotein Lpp